MAIRKSIAAAVLSGVIGGFAGLCHAQTVRFTPLGFLPVNGNFYSYAENVSDGNGTVTVVGEANTTSVASEAFSWTKAGGMVGLGGYSSASGVSADGSVVVGSDIGGSDTAWRWTQAGGKQYIGSGNASGVSADGTAIGGETNDAGWRWTTTGGRTSLPIPPGANSSYSPVLTISANGLYVGGQAAGPGSTYHAFVYNVSTGYTILPNPNNSPTDSAHFISDDASTVVGTATTGGSASMAIWKNGVLTTRVQSVGNYSGLIGQASSADGSLIGGTSFDDTGSAYIWDATNGARLLGPTLTNIFGVTNLTGWQLTAVNGISPDGRYLVGYGTDPQGYTEGFLVELPEPSAATLSLLTVGYALMRRRPRQDVT